MKFLDVTSSLSLLSHMDVVSARVQICDNLNSIIVGTHPSQITVTTGTGFLPRTEIKSAEEVEVEGLVFHSVELQNM